MCNELEKILSERIDQYFEEKNQMFAPSGNRSSSIGHTCERYLVYSRTRWNEAMPLGRGTLEIFEEGNDQERAVNLWLLNMGFSLHRTDQSFPPNIWNLTGHIDGMLGHPSIEQNVPVDIKSNHPNIYPTVNGVEDLNKKPWMKKWFYQFQAYMLLLDRNEFWILMKNKSVKQVKVIKIKRDEKTIDEIKAKCLSINNHIEKGTLPEKINDVTICETCQFRHLCLPEMKREAIELTNDPEFEIELDRRQELKAAHEEFQKIDKAVKKKVQNTEGNKLLCGNYIIEKKEIQRKSYTVQAGTAIRINISIVRD